MNLNYLNVLLIVAIMNRQSCVLCNNILEETYTQYNQPISFCPKSDVSSTDVFCDIIYGSCNYCGSLQLMNLIDPDILYKESHNNTFNTPTWKLHHKLFSDFILEYSNDNVLEIGGSSGILAKHILNANPTINYSIMDISLPLINEPNITYLIGNCENYNFETYNTVIMSHVFEHLYNPRKFIENISNNNVKHVFISIPNMNYLRSQKSLAVIHLEHTYYLEDIDAIILFSQYKYKLIKQCNFNNHSHFLYFQKDSNMDSLEWVNNNNRAIEILNIFKDRDEKLSNISVKPNSFIVPGGHYGQIMYLLMKNTHKNVIGFLDNDTSKQNKRMYGTDKCIYSFKYIEKYSINDKLNIYIHAGPYTTEIVEQILKNCPHATIHYV